MKRLLRLFSLIAFVVVGNYTTLNLMFEQFQSENAELEAPISTTKLISFEDSAEIPVRNTKGSPTALEFSLDDFFDSATISEFLPLITSLEIKYMHKEKVRKEYCDILSPPPRLA